MIMKIFPVYISRHFWGPFLFGVAVFSILVFLADAFEHLNTFIKSQASAGVILRYLLLGLPYWTMKVVPVATLLAVLFAIGELTGTGEWKAGMAGGYHPGQMALPLILCSAVVAAGSFVFQETVVPSLHARAGRIYLRDIRKEADWQKLKQVDVTLLAGKDRFISAHVFNAAEGTMQRALLDVHSGGYLITQIDAMSARWDSSIERWVFVNGVMREFTPKGGVAERSFGSWPSDVEVPPQNLMTEASSSDTDNMTARETLQRIKRLKKLGASALKEQVAFQSKLAFPLSNIVMCLLGIPFALAVRKSNRMLNFGMALGIAFLFWWVISIGQAAGESGNLPAALAAWGPIAVFGVLGMYGLKKVGVITVSL